MFVAKVLKLAHDGEVYWRKEVSVMSSTPELVTSGFYEV